MTAPAVDFGPLDAVSVVLAALIRDAVPYSTVRLDDALEAGARLLRALAVEPSASPVRPVVRHA